MKRTVIHEEKKVYFRGKYPDVMGVPHIMKQYPGYTPVVLEWNDYEARYGKG